ncbi:hypothetical protein RRF57_009185 [Xylaria bambusicola]|uniref:Uncharacterized protein n=1 Tax=Xylaria bambusicola TaxID=326684 RepID=A0AAN7ZBU1_9PEZI
MPTGTSEIFSLIQQPGQLTQTLAASSHIGTDIDLGGLLGKSTPIATSTNDDSEYQVPATETPLSQWKTMDLGILLNFHVVTYPVNRGDDKRLLVQFAVSSHRIHPDDADDAIDALCHTIAEFSSNPPRRRSCRDLFRFWDIFLVLSAWV